MYDAPAFQCNSEAEIAVQRKSPGQRIAQPQPGGAKHLPVGSRRGDRERGDMSFEWMPRIGGPLQKVQRDCFVHAAECPPRHAAYRQPAQLAAAPQRQVQRRRPPARSPDECLPVPSADAGGVRSGPGAPPREHRVRIRVADQEPALHQPGPVRLILDGEPGSAANLCVVAQCFSVRAQGIRAADEGAMKTLAESDSGHPGFQDVFRGRFASLKPRQRWNAVTVGGGIRVYGILILRADLDSMLFTLYGRWRIAYRHCESWTGFRTQAPSIRRAEG